MTSLRRHLGFSLRLSWIFGLSQNAVKTYFFASNFLNNFISPIQTGRVGGAFDATLDLNPLLLTNDCLFSIPTS